VHSGHSNLQKGRAGGAPVFGSRGRRIGAISTSGIITAITKEAARQIALSMMAACGKISGELAVVLY
jgi:DNA-binding IclR family transcriptional regulator